MNNSYQEQADVQESECGGPALAPAKRTIHFSSGETLEEEDSEEEEECSPNHGAFREPADRAGFSLKKVAALMGRLSLLACDFIGERLAGALGLNAPKYQYAIDRHQREQHKKTSSNQTTRGPTRAPAETKHLSPTPDGGLYGATDAAATAAAATAAAAAAVDPRDSLRAEKHQSKEGGRDNRGYQADEERRRKH